MASQHEHKHTAACKHGHNHNHNHQHQHQHVHGPNCKHNHTNQHQHQHHKHGPNCKHNDNKNKSKKPKHEYKELSAKQWEKRKARRKLRQYSRRVNHTIQNVIAAVWIWLLSESSLNTYYKNSEYDKIFMFHAFQILSLILFFYSSLSEPGFLEENNIQYNSDKKNDDEQVSLLSSTDDIDIDIENGSIIKINVDNETPPTFCRSCKFLRPIRSKHCYMCDKCVPRFDHHCPLIEQCVGARNYRQFYILCHSQLIVSGWSWIIAVNCLFYSESSNRSYFGWIVRILLFCWMCYQIFMAISLVSFHSYLICTQQTTFEFLKPKKLKIILKYNKLPKDKNNNYLAIDIDDNDNKMNKKHTKNYKGLPPPHKLLLTMCNGMGFCLCDYPFSEGIVNNWYGFITAKCLEKTEYFITKPVFVTKNKQVDNDKNGNTNQDNNVNNGNDDKQN